MPHSIDTPISESIEGDIGAKSPQRSPGWRQDVHPSATPASRGAADPNSDDWPPAVPEPQIVFTQTDGLGPARGIMLGVAVSVPIWVVLIFGVRYVLH
ncbi:MAG: hypothetical protein P4L71_01300 [Acetobacteraceae bacterium]|nr:hypothetical protein [Acetobacteraceae bacterium]